MDPVTMGAIGSVAAPILGFFGGERANRINQREAQKNRAFQAAEAGTNRAFQERMRNTEWQAAVADMEAAGINPAVAYARGGASSPGGSMPGGSQAAPASDSVSSAMSLVERKRGLELLEAQIANAKETAKRTRFEARQAGIKADFDTARYLYMFDSNGAMKEPLRRLLESEVSAAVGGSARALSDAELSRLSIPERQSMAKLFEQVGAGGKGMQLLMPLLLQLLRSSR